MLPNFLIIGAAKSGTTAIYTYIKQHPDIFMSPKKELRYFSNINPQPKAVPKQYIHESVSTLEEYKHYFDTVAHEKIIGESSPTYLYTPGTAENIKSHIPNVKLLAILRNPVDRAYSAYTHALREWKEPAKSFEEGLALETQRINAGWGMLWHYVNAGHYHKQLLRYYQCFKASQIKVVLHDDLVKSPEKLLEDLFIFLDVDPNFHPDISSRPNVSGFPKNKWFDNFLRTLFLEDNFLKRISQGLFNTTFRKKITTKIRKANLEKRAMPLELRKQLAAIFSEDIHDLEKLINRDLSHWLLG